MNEFRQNETLRTLEEPEAWIILPTVTQYFFRSTSSYKQCLLVHEFLQDASSKRDNKDVGSVLDLIFMARKLCLKTSFNI